MRKGIILGLVLAVVLPCLLLAMVVLIYGAPGAAPPLPLIGTPTEAPGAARTAAATPAAVEPPVTRVVAPTAAAAATMDEVMGRLAYNVVTEMALNREETVSAAITRDPGVNLSTQVPGRGTPVFASIPTTATMIVRLTASPDDFRIVADQDDAQAQLITPGVAHWQWEVTPLRTGTRHLELGVTVVFPAGLQRRVLDQPVDVQVAAPTLQEWLASAIAWLFARSPSEIIGGLVGLATIVWGGPKAADRITRRRRPARARG